MVWPTVCGMQQIVSDSVHTWQAYGIYFMSLSHVVPLHMHGIYTMTTPSLYMYRFLTFLACISLRHAFVAPTVYLLGTKRGMFRALASAPISCSLADQ
jgi:hypothetical protein